MDEAIEYLQIVIAKDFGYDDDVVIEKLRENMYELRSTRLDHPGRAPENEVPSLPFGELFRNYAAEMDVKELPADRKPKEWTFEKEAGLRKGQLIAAFINSLIGDNSFKTF